MLKNHPKNRDPKESRFKSTSKSILSRHKEIDRVGSRSIGYDVGDYVTWCGEVYLVLDISKPKPGIITEELVLDYGFNELKAIHKAIKLEWSGNNYIYKGLPVEWGDIYCSLSPVLCGGKIITIIDCSNITTLKEAKNMYDFRDAHVMFYDYQNWYKDFKKIDCPHTAQIEVEEEENTAWLGMEIC